LHRRIIRSLKFETDSSIVNICRTAAQARLKSAMDFVKSLRAEHLQSFWFSASTYCFAVVGTFISLLWATALSKEEADTYRERLEEYRWTLRLSSKSAEILERAVSVLTASTSFLVKAIPEKNMQSEDFHQVTGDPSLGPIEYEDFDGSEDWSVGGERAIGEDISMQLSPTQYSEEQLEFSWTGFDHQGGDGSRDM
jgi:hypothetical protein